MTTANNRFLVLDDRIISETKDLTLTLGRVEKAQQNPLFVEEYFADPPKKWEVRYDNLYPNIIYDPTERLYKLWYNVFIRASQSEETQLGGREGVPYTGGKIKDGLLYAISADGVTWSKPDLGLVSFDGSTDNNIVLDPSQHGIHGLGVLRDDADPDADRLYKAFFRDNKARKMAVAFSADGLHWSAATPWPEYDAVGDTHNNAIQMADGTFVGITRGWTGPKDDPVRMVLRAESSDFVNWSDPVNVFQGKDAHDQIYSMPIIRYANVYLGLPAMFHKGDPSAPDWDTVDTELAWSPDTITWNRVCHGEPLIPRGKGSYPTGEYDCGCIYAAAPILVGDKHYIYYGGSNGLHNNWREGSFCLATLPRDRFAGYSAGSSSAPGDSSQPGRLTTASFTLTSREISVNAEVAADGNIRSAILDSAGQPVPGFDRGDCVPVREGGLDVTLRWNTGVAELAGRELRLMVELTDSTLYAVSGDLRF